MLEMSRKFRGLEIDDDYRRVRCGRKWFPLTESEYAVLSSLAQGGTKTRDQLLTAIGGSNYAPTTRTIDQHIVRLRKKIGKNRITTVHSIGYCLRP
jgi:DNA-binding response OmpR family regulator